MTATFASSAWPVPGAPGALRTSPWRFAAEVVLPGQGAALQWMLRRNCSITPRQMGLAYASLCAVSLLVGGFFLTQGTPFVLGFAGIELLALGAAMLAFARHAGDRETLTLEGRWLDVEQCIGSRVRHARFTADSLTVEPAAGQNSLVELSGRGQRLRVGRFLRPELRAAFAGELRHALRRTAVRSAAPTDSN